MITRNKTVELDYLKNNEQFSTFDIGLASALATLNYELWGLDKSNPKKVQFSFRRKPGIDTAINNFWDAKLKLDARTLLDSLKMLKNRIYSI